MSATETTAEWAQRVAPKRFMVAKRISGPFHDSRRRYYNSREAADRAAKRMANELAEWMDAHVGSGFMYRVKAAEVVIYEGVAWSADMRGFRRRWDEVATVNVPLPEAVAA